MATRTGQETKWPKARCHYTAFLGDNRAGGEAEAQVRTIAHVERHVRAEESNDIDEIMDSITKEARFVVPVADASGRTFQIITTHQGVRRYYEDSRNSYEIVRSLHLKQIATDWYVFYESMATTRPVQVVNGARKIGGEQTGNSIVLFPTTRDGIIGEMPWGRFSGLAVEGARKANGASPLPMLQRRNTQVHDRFLSALQAGDVDGVLAPLADDFLLATRNYYLTGGPFFSGRGKPAARKYLEAMYRSVDVLGITILNRIIHDWYTFAELLLRLRHKGALLGVPPTGAEFHVRTAAMYPMTEDGQIAGEVGYGTDIHKSLTAAIRAKG